jgi:hypothetical protein
MKESNLGYAKSKAGARKTKLGYKPVISVRPPEGFPDYSFTVASINFIKREDAVKFAEQEILWFEERNMVPSPGT